MPATFRAIGRVTGRRLDVAAILCLALASSGWDAGDALAAPKPAVSPRLDGESERVFVWKDNPCRPKFNPDTPARAFRDDDGQLHLFATNHLNRQFLGDNMDDLRLDCDVVFAGAHSPEPSDFDDRAWLASFYTLDGRRVYALVHNEFHGHRRPAICPSQKYVRCWYNVIVQATSADGGNTFSRSGETPDFVAGVPYRYDSDMRPHRGLFNPTNIVRRGDYFYFMAYATGHDLQKRGNCLVRTDDLSRPESWRAWDGSDFTVSFVDPYRAGDIDPGRHVCEPVAPDALRWPVGSIVWSSTAKVFIAVSIGRGQDPEAGQMANGIVLFTSPDLVEWSAPTLLMRAAAPSGFRCGGGDAVVQYPSLLDPNSPTRNFETVDDDAYLYFTEWNIDDCDKSIDRDLVRVKVNLSPRAE